MPFRRRFQMLECATIMIAGGPLSAKLAVDHREAALDKSVEYRVATEADGDVACLLTFSDRRLVVVEHGMERQRGNLVARIRHGLARSRRRKPREQQNCAG